MRNQMKTEGHTDLSCCCLLSKMYNVNGVRISKTIYNYIKMELKRQIYSEKCPSDVLFVV